MYDYQSANGNTFIGGWGRMLSAPDRQWMVAMSPDLIRSFGGSWLSK